MPDKKLVVIGDGPEMKKIRSKASKNIEILGHVSYSSLIAYMQGAKAFVYAAEEDFGIAPVEAQACGTPVVAFGKGGSLETVTKNVSGLFFYEQSVASITNAIKEFEKIDFDYEKVRTNAEKFSKEIFEHKFKEFVNSKI
jgi:glycosyltransferase involved in cell wall biosynthesis